MLNHDERIPNESVKHFEYAKDTQENTRVRFRRTNENIMQISLIETTENIGVTSFQCLLL